MAENFREEKARKHQEFMDKFEERLAKGKTLLPPTRHKIWEKHMQDLADARIAEVEDPVEVELAFMEAWKNGASNEDLKKIVQRLEMPRLAVSDLQLVMGNVLDGFVDSYYGVSLDVETKKKRALKFDGNFQDLEEVIAALKEAKENGNNFYIEFQGQKLYSLFDDENSCYQKITGQTKEDYEEAMSKTSGYLKSIVRETLKYVNKNTREFSSFIEKCASNGEDRTMLIYFNSVAREVKLGNFNAAYVIAHPTENFQSKRLVAMCAEYMEEGGAFRDYVAAIQNGLGAVDKTAFEGSVEIGKEEWLSGILQHYNPEETKLLVAVMKKVKEQKYEQAYDLFVKNDCPEDLEKRVVATIKGYMTNGKAFFDYVVEQFKASQSE